MIRLLRSSKSLAIGIAIVGILFVVLAGRILLRNAIRNGETSERAHLRARTVTAAASLDIESLRALTGKPTDEPTTNFQRLQAQLRKTRQANADVRYAYLMGWKDGKVVFLLDTADPSSSDYSPPGEIYQEASQELIRSFTDGQPFVEGPVSDRWGNWVSGLAPISDPTTHRVIAVLGLDVSANHWLATLSNNRVFVFAVTGLLALIVLFFSTGLYYQSRVNERVSSLNQALSKELHERELAEQELREGEIRLRIILDSVQTGIIVIDPETRRIVDANPVAVNLIGAPKDQIVGAECHKFICAAERGKCPVIDLGQGVDHAERVLLTASGEERPVIKTVVPVVLDGRRHLLENFVDITERKRVEEALRLTQFSVDTASDAIFWLAPDASYIYVNDAACRLVGYSREELLAMAAYNLNPAQPKEGWPAYWADLKRRKSMTYKAGLRAKNSRVVPMKLTANLLEFGGKEYNCSFARDITERKRVEEMLQYLSIMDGLTNIANRRAFDDRFEKEWRRAVRERQPLSVIMSDIDYFKPYNDQYGHQAGDKCLQKIAVVMEESIRRPGDLAARYDGEEFAVLMPATDAEGAALIAKKIRQAVEALRMAHEASSAGEHVTISIGVATITPRKSDNPGSLIAAADQALYQAKGAGRNRVVQQTILDRPGSPIH